jgi:4a-hydroxytetrahydrobiopterin dehydratase
MNGLSDAELETALSGLPGWKVEGGQLAKTYKLRSFRDAMALLQRVAFEAEEMNHHPEIYNLYNRVRFALCTHDAGEQVTEKDVALASRIEQLTG